MTQVEKSSLYTALLFGNSIKTRFLRQIVGDIYKISQRQLYTTTTKRTYNLQNQVQTNKNNIMVVQHNVKGYEDFIKLVGELEGSGQPIHVLFSGGKDESGNSWCPYCVKGKHDMKTTNYV